MPVIAGDTDVDTYKWPRLHGVAVATFFMKCIQPASSLNVSLQHMIRHTRSLGGLANEKSIKAYYMERDFTPEISDGLCGYLFLYTASYFITFHWQAG